MISSPMSTQEPTAPRALSISQQQEIAETQALAAAPDNPYCPALGNPYPSSVSLYVGELDPSVQESTLHEIFSAIGTVESVRVCRDAITRKSLGYAFVSFKSQVEGERALHALNYTEIQGKPCRIMWSQRDLAKRKLPGGNIFIRNLDPIVTAKALHDTFSQFGSIISCKVVADSNGHSKGYGFVHYDTVEAAENAIQHVNGTILYDRELFVGHHIPKRERQQRQDDMRQRFTNVFVKNLMPDIKEDELKEMFDGFGTIVSTLIQRDEHGNSKGYGFVNFERHEDAERAVQKMNDTEYFGRRLFVSRAQKKSEREEEMRRNQHHSVPESRQETKQQNRYQGTNLYVKNLDNEVDDQRLRDEFSKYGAITSVKVMRDEQTGQSKGYGFVCFSIPHEATKAVAEMNGRMISSKAVYVALAQRKEDRRNHNDHHMMSRNNQLHLQQPFMPVPVTTYVPSGPIYYDYNGGLYSHMISPSSGRPPRGSWSHPQSPASYMKQGYSMPAPVPAYINYVVPNRSMYVDQPQSRPVAPQPRPEEVNQYAPAAEGPALYQDGQDSSERSSDAHSPVELTMDMISSYPKEMQKQILGERIYAVVHANYPKLAGKVTGMLLEMDKEDLVALINDQSALESKAAEAVAVLEQHRASQQ